MQFHLLHNVTIAFQSQYRRQILLRSGEAEGTATNVVGTLSVQTLHVFEGVGSSTDDSVLAKQTACFVHRHVVLAKMYAVSSGLFHPFCVVVKHKHGIMLLA